MAWSLIPGAHTSGLFNAVSAIDTRGADCIFIVQGDFLTTRQPSDTQSNIWSHLTGASDGAGTAVNIWYCVNPSTSQTHGFNPQGSGSAISVAAFSGSAATPFDVENGAHGGTSPLNTGSITPSQGNELFIAGFGSNGLESSVAVDSSFTLGDVVLSFSGSHYGAALAYKIQGGTAAAENPAFSWSGAGGVFAVTVASFKAAASGGTTLALTGTAATGSVGTLAPSISRALTGNAATGATGTLTSPYVLSGTAATGSPGTLKSAAAYALTGTQATASVGSLANAVSYALTGTQATGSAGSVGAQGSVTIALSGVAATAALGTLAPAISSALTGIAGAGALGSVPNVVTYGLTANAATGAVGSLVAVGDITAALTGAQATGAVGTLSASGGDTAAWRASGPRGGGMGSTPHRSPNLNTRTRT